ncbi:MAG: MFS transporter, partial [Gemmatimonadota bacterium]
MARHPDSASALLGQRDYLIYLSTRSLGVLATAAQSVTMGWQVYDMARAERGIAESALYVGILGLVTFLPLFLLALPAGVVADRYPRKRVLSICFLGEAVCAALLVGTALSGHLTVNLLLGIAVLFGISRAFRAPAGVALAPMLVPEVLLPRAIAWSSLAFQMGSIGGPVLAGYMVGRWSSTHSYAVSLVLYLVPVVGLAFVRHPT